MQGTSSREPGDQPATVVHPSALALFAIDEGGQVDTLEQNRRAIGYTLAQIDEYAAPFKQLKTAMRLGDVAALGAVATHSARLNQRAGHSCLDACSICYWGMQPVGQVFKDPKTGKLILVGQ